VFLTAEHQERASRRARQDGLPDTELAATADDLQRRDRYDSSRPLSPLRRADDAVEVDTTRLDIGEVVDLLVDMARSRGISATQADGRPGEQR
jgi:cytidylate kinase